MRNVTDPTRAYTDGACSGNPGPGGWAWVVPDGAFRSGSADHTTNQRMEITAAFDAVESLDGRLVVVSDSTYVVNCFRDRWWDGWLERGWVNAKKEPVKNRDLWEPFIELVRSRGDVTFEWVKGHNDDPWNEVADRLAVEAALEQRGRSGDGPPTDLGPADSLRRRARAATDSASGSALGSTSAGGGRDPRLPAGHLIGVFGHRPPALGGYEANPVAARISQELRDILRAKRKMHDDVTVVSGLQLGAETLGAEAALAEGIPLVAVLGFPDFDSAWPRATRDHFRHLVDGADEVIMLEKKVPDSKAKIGGALRRRDAWLARNVDEAVIVWDQSDESLAKLARTLDEQLDADVWFLTP
jgi:ribonuclease HI/uncharacterized phage-like protein YoqJ